MHILNAMYFFFGIIGGILVLLGVFAVIISIPTLGIKFDKLFRHLPNPIEPGIPGLNLAARTFCYMGCIVFKHKSSKSKIFSLIYEGYDFRGNSNLFQKVISFIGIWGAIIGITFGFIWFILKWLIHFHA